MNIERNIKIKHKTDNSKEIDHICNIVFPMMGTWGDGCGFHDGMTTNFYLNGRWSFIVAVYSALCNNGYKPILTEVDDN